MGLQPEDWEWLGKTGVQRARSVFLQPWPGVGESRGWERPYAMQMDVNCHANKHTAPAVGAGPDQRVQKLIPPTPPLRPPSQQQSEASEMLQSEEERRLDRLSPGVRLGWVGAGAPPGGRAMSQETSQGLSNSCLFTLSFGSSQTAPAGLCRGPGAPSSGDTSSSLPCHSCWGRSRLMGQPRRKQ